MDREMLERIIRQYDVDTLKFSRAYGDGGIEGVWPRLERAAGNQISDGDATCSRYGIWANTVRDNVIAAIDYIKNDRPNEAEKLLIRVANNLSAYAEIQKLQDPIDW